MPRLKLSQPAVDRLRQPPGDKAVTHWDVALRGFAVRVSRRGRKTYLAQYRVKGAGADGKDLEVVQTLGTSDKVTLAEAQRQARASFALAREGIHPVQQRRHKQAAAQAIAAAQAFTFERLAARYLAEYVDRNNRASTAKQARRLLLRAARTPYAGRCFGELPASVITRSDIDAVMAAVLASKTARAESAPTGGLVEANRLLGALQRCFKWARAHRLIETDPTLDVLKPLKAVPTRDRFLDDDEVIAFWSGCELVGWQFGSLFRLLLLTGQRLNEVAGMRRSEVNLDKRTWTLPRERTKNGKAHEVALSDLAVTILQGLPRYAGSDFIFPSERGDGPVVSFNYAKKTIVEQMAAPDWRLHDLRRTCTTGMARLGIAPHVADKVLNHQSGTIRGVAAVYNRFEYLPERRDALNRWGDFVARLVGANVVAMRRRSTDIQ